MDKPATELTSFLRVGGNIADTHAFAGHLADRISALERNLQNARCSGDVGLMSEIQTEIAGVRREAHEAGLDRNEYPGLFR